MSMKWLIVFFGIAASLLLFTPRTSAQGTYGRDYDDYGYTTSNDDFTLGYRQGFDHGFADRRTGLDFDFEHSAAYQHGTAEFQSGYEQGYTDAYNRRPSQMDQGRNEGYRSGYVELFGDTGFRGNRMTLGVGRYPSVDLDDVQSLHVNGDVRVILFNERNFEGRSITVTDDNPSLRFMQSRSFWPFGIMRHRTGSMIIEPIR